MIHYGNINAKMIKFYVVYACRKFQKEIGFVRTVDHQLKSRGNRENVKELSSRATRTTNFAIEKITLCACTYALWESNAVIEFQILISSFRFSSSREKMEPKDKGRCKVCNERGNTIGCSKCQKRYHLNCLLPPLRKPPTINWACHSCRHISARKGNVASVIIFIRGTRVT